MKMAKATEKDIEAAGELLGILDTIDARFGGPWATDGPESLEQALDGDEFDADNREHLQGLYNSLAKLLRQSPNFHGRVIGGMCYVILYDKNQIVDPGADCLEIHPRFEASMKDAERYRWLKACNSGSIGITTFNTDEALERVLVEDDADATIDAAMAAALHANFTLRGKCEPSSKPTASRII